MLGFMLKTFSNTVSDICNKYIGCALHDDTINKIITDLNNIVFPDNFAEFENKSTPEDIDKLCIILCIKYKGQQYDILGFENIYLRHQRKEKLKKINKVRYENIEKNYNKRYRIC